MSHEMLPDTRAWHKTLQEMLVNTDEHFLQDDEAAAIEAALAEIDRLELALEAVAGIALAAKRKMRKETNARS